MSRVRLLAAVVVAVAGLPREAAACGGSGPGGTGMCALGEHRTQPPMRVGASVALTDTTILFGEGRRAGMTRTAVFGSFAMPVAPRLSFEASLGGFASGELRTPVRAVGLGPGLVTALGLTVRAVEGRGAAPLVVVSGTFSSSFVRGEEARHVEAYDLRATVMVGKTIAEVVTPYVLGRGFGGPIWFRWDDGERVQGTDLYKYQLGAGVSVATRYVDLFVEGAPLGERTFAAGLGVRL